MAACQLKIELDASDAPRVGGQTISGVVVVTASEPVKCSGLAVSTYWTTHGRGNVEKGVVDQCVVFQGAWEAGREYRYPFTLRCAAWPPTYYGNYLNVSHFVAAQAKVPWSFDPKTQLEFAVAAGEAPADLKPTRAAKSQSASWIGWVIAIVVLAVFGAMFSVLALFLLPIIGVAGFSYWFCRVFLPRRLLGNVECTVEPTRLTAGGTINGQLRCTPRRDVTIDGIQWSLTCGEKCVSGSGSNKTTHRHEVFRKSIPLAEAGVLRMGQPQSFELVCPIPEQAPVSLKFRENELTWVGELRIGIPRWPDWVKSFPITVVPAGQPSDVPPLTGSAARSVSLPASVPEDVFWFEEVLAQVQRSSDEPTRLQAVLAAVREQVFALRIDITGPRPEQPAQIPSEAGTWLFALYRPLDAELCLLWPVPLEPPGQTMSNWCGQAMIIGYDEELDCLLMRVVGSQAA